MHNELYTTEYEVESKFIEIIQRNWYRYSPISSYDELLNNFRDKLNNLNKEVLNGDNLSNIEFKEIVMYLEKYF